MARKRPRGKKPPSPKMRSGFEGKTAGFLDKAGLEYEYETEKIPYTVPETKKNYIPDFIVKTGRGRTLYCENKGIFDLASRKKMLLVIQQHPELDIRMLLMRDNFIRKGSKTKYSQFCEKHGIPYAISPTGAIPEEWLV